MGPAYCLGAIRRKGDVNLFQAFARNLASSGFDGKGKIQVEDPRW